ncbi:MAG: Fic family protein [Leptospiraceae bacterium]|nr:Fic family protein [Leptospiraceae bacterium]
MLNWKDHYWNILPNRDKALMIAKKQLPEFVYDAVNLEGIPFTLPEIQTLLDGISVGGHKLSDQQIAINQRDAWKELFYAIEKNEFEVSIDFVCGLHKIAAKEEALKWGVFRDGSVYISGTDYEPPSHLELVTHFESMLQGFDQFEDIYDLAIHVFLQMSRHQFFFDVNKRMGRFMMNGILLNAGFPAINLLSKYQLEFNSKMLRFYESGDEKEMNQFMRDCMPEKILRIMKE